MNKMMETFYIASSRDGLPSVIELATFLEGRGMRNTFAWPEHFTHRCSADGCGIRDRADLSRRELNAAGGCDLFVGISRLGKGSHVELGAALTGRAKRVILVGVDLSDLVFYDDARVERVPDMAALYRLLSMTEG